MGYLFFFLCCNPPPLGAHQHGSLYITPPGTGGGRGDKGSCAWVYASSAPLFISNGKKELVFSPNRLEKTGGGGLGRREDKPGGFFSSCFCFDFVGIDGYGYGKSGGRKIVMGKKDFEKLERIGGGYEKKLGRRFVASLSFLFSPSWFFE